MANYSSAEHTLSWNGIKLSEGYEGSSITPNGDLVEVHFDLKGRMHKSRLANQGGVITVTYVQGCESLKKIDDVSSGLQLLGEFYETGFDGIFMFEDPVASNSFVAWNATLISTGDIENADVIGQRTPTWHCEKLIRTSSPLDVIANIAAYLGE